MPDPSNLPDTNIIRTIEDGLVEQLKRYLPSEFYISPFPAEIKTFDQAQRNAAALVHFAGSRYAATSEMSHARQTRELRYAVTLYLSGHFGGTQGYQVLEKVRLALQNYMVAGATPIRLISDQLADQQSDQWVWQVDIACSVPSVAGHQSPPRPMIGQNHPFTRFKQEEA